MLAHVLLVGVDYPQRMALHAIQYYVALYLTG